MLPKLNSPKKIAALLYGVIYGFFVFWAIKDGGWKGRGGLLISIDETPWNYWIVIVFASLLAGFCFWYLFFGPSDSEDDDIS